MISTIVLAGLLTISIQYVSGQSCHTPKPNLPNNCQLNNLSKANILNNCQKSTINLPLVNIRSVTSPILNHENNLLANSVPKSLRPCNSESSNLPLVVQPTCSVPVNLPTPCRDVPAIKQSTSIIRSQGTSKPNSNLPPPCQITPAIVQTPTLIENFQGSCLSPTVLGQINLPRPQYSYPLPSKETVTSLPCQSIPPCFNGPFVSNQPIVNNVACDIFNPLVCEEPVKSICGPSVVVPQPNSRNCGCNKCLYPTDGHQICQNLPVLSTPCLSNNQLTLGPQLPCFSSCKSAQLELPDNDCCSEPIIPFYPCSPTGVDDVLISETPSIETTAIDNVLPTVEDSNCGCDYCMINCPMESINCPSFSRSPLPSPCQFKSVFNPQVARSNIPCNQPLNPCSLNPPSNQQALVFGSSLNCLQPTPTQCANSYPFMPESLTKLSYPNSPCLAPIVPMVSIPEVNMENGYFYPFLPAAYPGSCCYTATPFLPPVQINTCGFGECYRLTKPIPPPFI